jgi:phosphate transport system substrate-binding protein
MRINFVKTRLTQCVVAVALSLGLSIPAIAGTQLTGAGSTFDYPFFSKAFYTYSQKHPDVTVNYQPIGSGGGIAQFTAKTVDFGATDVPMNAGELSRAGAGVIQIPVALGGESIVYNLPGIHSGLHLTRQLIANIYLGKVTSWNDRAIANLNKGTRLPNLPIIVVHRSDGSGTTYIFTDFLSHVSPAWKKTVGVGKSVNWPAPSSVGGKGNEGVSGQVNNSPGSIGYVELAYAVENHMDSAALQNQAGDWVNDSPAGVASAAATKPGISAQNFSIVDSGCASCYPIAGYSWAVVFQNMADRGRARLIHDVLSYVVGNDGQRIAGTLDYVPLPQNVQNTARGALKRMHF